MRPLKITPLHLFLLLAALFATSCSSNRNKKAHSKVNLDYEVSTSDAIHRSDLFIGQFMDIMEKYPPQNSSVPPEVLTSAEMESRKLQSHTAITNGQKRINIELIHFYLLDRYLLPSFQSNGNADIEYSILNCLVKLKDLESTSELNLQTRCLNAISQGGYYYPELQKHLLSAISQKISHSGKDKTELQKAKEILSGLEKRSIH